MEAGAGVACRLRVTRLLLDEMYPIALAENLRGARFDVLAVLEVDGLPRTTDPGLLEWASQHDRAIVTENVDDFARLSHEPHAGIILVRAPRWPRGGAGMARLEAALRGRLSSDVRVSIHVVEWL